MYTSKWQKDLIVFSPNIYICVCIYIYTYMYTCIHIYTYTYVYVYIYIYVYMYVYMYTCIHICVYICICIYLCDVIVLSNSTGVLLLQHINVSNYHIVHLKLTQYIQEVKSLSHVWLFKTPWTVAHQAPLSIGFPWTEYWSREQEYWSGLPFSSPGALPNPTQGSNPGLLHCRQTPYQLSHERSPTYPML